VNSAHIQGRLFAIGDIHGCSIEVEALLGYLITVLGIDGRDKIVFLGDYVDRGPDSKGVIDILISFKNSFPNTVFLKGNHEDMMLDFLGYGGRLGVAYLRNGGQKCLESYSIPANDSVKDIVKKFPVNHLEFLQSLLNKTIIGDFLFVHAGVNPTLNILDQTEDDLFWIRDEFILQPHTFPYTVVFGHTPFKYLFLDLPYKIGIDTGLVFGNILSCVNLTEQRVYQVLRGSKGVKEFELPSD
jgi:serine/threonine protein phosphatase 1